MRNVVGMISIAQWCITLEKCTGLQIPWRLLKDKLVTIDPETKMVHYQTTFDIKGTRLNVSITFLYMSTKFNNFGY